MTGDATGESRALEAPRVEARRVGPEVVVRLAYALFDGEGELVEAPGPDEALEFIFGAGQAPVAIERAIDGLALGETGRVELQPGGAFGERDEGAVLIVERTELPADAALGDELEAENDAGEVVYLRVVELDDVEARLDANHPLAGQRVALELSVIDLRVASSVELAVAEFERVKSADQAPDVLVSDLLRRDRFTPPRSG